MSQQPPTNGPYGEPPANLPPPGGPYGGPPPPGSDPVKAWPVILGLVLGAVVSWVYLAVVIFTGMAVSYDNSSSGSGNSGLGIVGSLVLAALPIVAAVVLLSIRRTRQMGAGFVMGLSIGTIIGAGICALPVVGMLFPGA